MLSNSTQLYLYSASYANMQALLTPPAKLNSQWCYSQANDVYQVGERIVLYLDYHLEVLFLFWSLNLYFILKIYSYSQN